VTTLDEPGRRLRVQVGTKGDDEDVRFEGAGIGLDPLGVRVDGEHRRADETHARLDQITVRVHDRCRQRPAEHDVQLGEPEDETVALIDQDHVGGVPEPLGQPRRQLETAESSAEDQDPHAPQHSGTVAPRTHAGPAITAGPPARLSIYRRAVRRLGETSTTRWRTGRPRPRSYHARLHLAHHPCRAQSAPR
jgi:hypothetical protein